MDERLVQEEGTQICLYAYNSYHTVSLNTVETCKHDHREPPVQAGNRCVMTPYEFKVRLVR